MPEIKVIFDSIKSGKTLIVISDDKTFSQLITRYCKHTCISKKIIPSLHFIFNGNEISSSSSENIEKLSIRNFSIIVVKTEEENNNFVPELNIFHI